MWIKHLAQGHNDRPGMEPDLNHQPTFWTHNVNKTATSLESPKARLLVWCMTLVGWEGFWTITAKYINKSEKPPIPTFIDGGHSLSCDQVDRHPIGRWRTGVRNMSEVIFLIHLLKKELKTGSCRRNTFFFFFFYKVHFLFMRGAQLNLKVAQSAGRRLNAAFSLLL